MMTEQNEESNLVLGLWWVEEEENEDREER